MLGLLHLLKTACVGSFSLAEKLLKWVPGRAGRHPQPYVVDLDAGQLLDGIVPTVVGQTLGPIHGTDGVKVHEK